MLWRVWSCKKNSGISHQFAVGDFQQFIWMEVLGFQWTILIEMKKWRFSEITFNDLVDNLIDWKFGLFIHWNRTRLNLLNYTVNVSFFSETEGRQDFRRILSKTYLLSKLTVYIDLSLRFQLNQIRLAREVLNRLNLN